MVALVVIKFFPGGEFNPAKMLYPPGLEQAAESPSGSAPGGEKVFVRETGPPTLEPVGELPVTIEEKPKPKKAVRYVFSRRQVPAGAELESILTADSLVDRTANATSFLSEEPEQLLSMLRGLDTEPPVLEIEAVLGVFRLDVGYEFGMEWLLDSTGVLELVPNGARAAIGGALSLTVTDSAFQFSLEEGARKGFLHVMSRPLLACVSGTTATLTTGRQIAVPVRSQTNFESRTSVEFREVLLSITVEPVMVGGRVLMKVTQTNDDVLGFKVIDGNEVPELATQTLESSLRVSLGDWFALGGATLVTHQSGKQATTILDRVPVLNRLVGQESESWDRVEFGVFMRVSEGSAASVPVSIEKPSLVELDQAAPERIQKRRFWDRFRRKGNAGK